jgi:MOSC domain-containing protein YiiM
MEILPEEQKYAELLDNFVQTGEVKWIGVRPAKGEPVVAVLETTVQIGGLLNDHYNTGNPDKKRQVTVIQHEHLLAVASFLGKENIDPSLFRRNIVIKGINLHALTGKQFRIGEAVLEITGYCYPCNRMEKTLGNSGYNAMRGHGGFNCRVLKEGKVRIGDEVFAIQKNTKE